MPLSYFPGLPPLSNNAFDPWMKDPTFDPCHSLISSLAVEEHMPWGVPNTLEPGLDGRSIPQSLYEEVGHLSCTTG